MKKFLILIGILIISFGIIFSQELDQQTKAKIDEYQANIDKFLSEGSNGNAVNYMIKIANIYWQSDNLDLAIKYFSDAELLLVNSSNYNAKIQLYNSLGYLYNNKNDFISAEKYFTQAYDIQEQSGDKKALNSLLLNIAQTQHKQNKIKEATESYSQALSIALEIDDLAMVKNSAFKFAQFYNQIGDNNNYAYYYNLSMNFDKKIKDREIENLAKENIKQTLLAQQRNIELQNEELKGKRIKRQKNARLLVDSTKN